MYLESSSIEKQEISSEQEKHKTARVKCLFFSLGGPEDKERGEWGPENLQNKYQPA